ncbi:MAG: hypothetical protein D4R44_02600 [Actinobacteria bacterium]|nr:MAG: hypothetical protein D4R44_02600 [Actinomycetota bacterium]
MVTSWLLVMVAIAAVAITSRNIGKPTWWLGPQSNPSFILLWALPFSAPIISIIATVRFSRQASYVGLVAAIALGAIAAGDIKGTPGVAAIEATIAVSSALFSIAAFAGRTTVSPE